MTLDELELYIERDCFGPRTEDAVIEAFVCFAKIARQQQAEIEALHRRLDQKERAGVGFCPNHGRVWMTDLDRRICPDCLQPLEGEYAGPTGEPQVL